ncbi:helix-turn-helix transcriptional regulator [Candidatus Pacearchaeota archaeon]|nr:helix-turn-helix transcriptional regulator [Candidatus Pacearchaeota archaeon]
MKRTSIQLDVHDPRLSLITEALRNKTARVLLDRLSAGPASSGELVSALSLPFSTVDYTIKKLVDAGLVVPASSWWSVKGKKVVKYELAHTQFIISPRPLLKGVLPALLGSGLFAVLIKISGVGTSVLSDTSMKVASDASASSALMERMPSDLIQPGANVILPDIALWFLLGSCVGIGIFLVWNYYVSLVKGGSVS